MKKVVLMLTVGIIIFLSNCKKDENKEPENRQSENIGDSYIIVNNSKWHDLKFNLNDTIYHFFHGAYIDDNDSLNISVQGFSKGNNSLGYEMQDNFSFIIPNRVGTFTAFYYYYDDLLFISNTPFYFGFYDSTDSLKSYIFFGGRITGNITKLGNVGHLVEGDFQGDIYNRREWNSTTNQYDSISTSISGKFSTRMFRP